VAIALVIGLLVGAAATYAVARPGLSRTTTVTSISYTTTVTIDSTQEVRDAYAAYLQSMKSDNISAVVAKYANNATFEYYVASPLGGMGGGAVGAAQIRQFYNQNLLFMHPTVNFANETYAVSILGNGNEATVHSNLTMYGNSVYPAPPNNATSVYVGNAVLFIVFVHLGNDWVIFHESWNYVNAVSGCQSFSSPGCSTLLRTPNWVKEIWPPGQ
jgi:ketosteroid isomerase-like protein